MPSSPINCQVTVVDGLTEGAGNENGFMVEVEGSEVFRLYTKQKHRTAEFFKKNTFYSILYSYPNYKCSTCCVHRLQS